MAEQQEDYSQVYDFIYRIDRRVGYLEKDASFIESQVSLLEERRVKRFDSLKTELLEMRKMLAIIKQNFNACTHDMSLLSKDLKYTAKKEEIEGLNGVIEELRFEEYVTHRDIQRGV
ncbi:MAG: hypothetical protein ACP5NW_03330 [Candidatus Woesearchaeota archaeon]